MTDLDKYADLELAQKAGGDKLDKLAADMRQRAEAQHPLVPVDLPA